MKKIMVLTSVVCLLALFSFTAANNQLKGEQVFEVTDDGVIHLTEAGAKVVSEQDLVTLSKYVVGWTECAAWSTWINCVIVRQTFPDAIQERAIVQGIIDKYNK